jgi:hypothetical protein
MTRAGATRAERQGDFTQSIILVVISIRIMKLKNQASALLFTEKNRAERELDHYDPYIMLDLGSFDSSQRELSNGTIRYRL